MAGIREHLTVTKGFSHLFMMEDASRDPNSTGDNTTATVTNGGFVAEPVCGGAANSFRADDGDDEGITGLVISNTEDINVGNDPWRRYCISLWFRIPVIDVPTCVYEQGGGTNNQGIMVGLARAITSQAADSGQPFLIAQSNFQAEPNRNYHVVHNWFHGSMHLNGAVTIQLIINGVLQEEVTAGGTSVFPNHSGDVTFGNANDALRSYNSSTQNYAGRAKYGNKLALGADMVLTELEAREIYEMTVLPEITIVGTKKQQQDQLDSLIGTKFESVNCAMRVEHATDEAGDYRLFVDSINFVKDNNLKDIAVQYVGQHTLTLENCNGANTEEVSAPTEVNNTDSSVVVGGGSIVLVDNVLRLSDSRELSDVLTYDKIVISETGGYVFNNVRNSTNTLVVENISQGEVNISSSLGLPTIINTGSSTTIVLDSFLSFTGNWQLFGSVEDRNSTTNIIAEGTPSDRYRFSISGAATFYLWVDGIKWEVEPTSSGETSVDLSTSALLSLVNRNLGFIENIVYFSASAQDIGDGRNSAPFKSGDDAIREAISLNASYVSILDTTAATALTPTIPAVGVNFRGKNQPTCFLNPNNQDFTNCQLDNLRVFGQFNSDTAEMVLSRILMLEVHNINGVFRNCKFLGSMSFNGDSYLDDCNINNSIAPQISVLGAYTIEMEEVEGNFVLQNLPVGSVCIVSIQGGTVTLGDEVQGNGGFGTSAIVIMRGHYTLVRNDSGNALVIEDKIGSIKDLASIQLYAQQAAQNTDYLLEK